MYHIYSNGYHIYVYITEHGIINIQVGNMMIGQHGVLIVGHSTFAAATIYTFRHVLYVSELPPPSLGIFGLTGKHPKLLLLSAGTDVSPGFESAVSCALVAFGKGS